MSIKQIKNLVDFKSFKFWINILTLVALGLLFYFTKDQIIEAFKTFGSLNLIWLFMVIPLQLLNYFSVAKFYQSYLKTLGEKIRTRELYKVGLEMNFVNNVFPSGGVSGFGYLGVRLRKLGVRGSKSTLLQTSRHFLTFLTFIVYLLLALLLLSIFGSASRLIILIASTLSSFIIFGSLILIYIISDENRIKQFTAALPNLVNKIVSFFHKDNVRPIKVEKIEKLFGELNGDYKHVKKNWRDLRYPFLWSMLMNFTEIATIFVVYLSFGELVNPGAIIISYAVANIAGLVSILPGGVGIYEGLMTAIMASAGVDKALALSATVVYRVFNMSIFLPVGYFFYQRALKQDDIYTEKVPGLNEDDD
jgi:uncharacterized protein (TIRG00374 family)